MPKNNTQVLAAHRIPSHLNKFIDCWSSEFQSLAHRDHVAHADGLVQRLGSGKCLQQVGINLQMVIHFPKKED